MFASVNQTMHASMSSPNILLGQIKEPKQAGCKIRTVQTSEYKNTIKSNRKDLTRNIIILPILNRSFEQACS